MSNKENDQGRRSRAFWIRTPGHGEILVETLPPRQEGEVRVEALYSGVSRGTEALVFRGEVPPSQYEAMRAPFQDGDFPGPVKYGYSNVGRVLEGPTGPEATGGSQGLEGRLVFCLHPHQDLYQVPAEAVVPLPEGVPPERAVLAANMETAVNAVWDGGPSVGDRVVVVGGGVVGLCTAWLASRIPGTRVTVVDLDRSREPVAQALGVGFARSSVEQHGDADLVVHSSGDPAGLRASLELAGQEGRVLELSWYGSRKVSLPLGEAFHSRRLKLDSSQVGRVPPQRAPRWSRRRRLELALELLRHPEMDHLVSGESDFEALPDLLSDLARSPEGVLCHRIRYPHS